MDTQKILSKGLTLLLLTTMTLNTGLTTVYAATNEADSSIPVQQTESVSAMADSSDSIEIDSSMESEESIDTTETTETTEAIIEQQPADSNIETDIVPEAAEPAVSDAVPSATVTSEDSDVAEVEAASSGEVYDREALAEQAMQMMADDFAQNGDFQALSRSLTLSPTTTFINNIAASAMTTWSTHQVLPSITIAQAILESGAGTSGLSRAPYYNLFGIKGSNSGASITLPTEEDNGQGQLFTINAAFRVYPSYQESLEDYVELIRTGISGNQTFYQKSWRSTAKNYLSATQNLMGKYATDTFYSASWWHLGDDQPNPLP